MEKATTHQPETLSHSPVPASLPSSAPRSDYPLFNLQRAVGNQAVGRLLESGIIQAKLRVSRSGDADEQEADRVAAAVTSTLTTPAPSFRSPIMRKNPASGDVIHRQHRERSSQPSTEVQAQQQRQRAVRDQVGQILEDRDFDLPFVLNHPTFSQHSNAYYDDHLMPISSIADRVLITLDPAHQLTPGINRDEVLDVLTSAYHRKLTETREMTAQILFPVASVSPPGAASLPFSIAEGANFYTPVGTWSQAIQHQISVNSTLLDFVPAIHTAVRNALVAYQGSLMTPPLGNERHLYVQGSIFAGAGVGVGRTGPASGLGFIAQVSGGAQGTINLRFLGITLSAIVQGACMVSEFSSVRRAVPAVSAGCGAAAGVGLTVPLGDTPAHSPSNH